MDLQKALSEYSARVAHALMQSDFGKLDRVADIFLDARERGAWIFIAGNGGSAANASHMTNDLVKGLSVEGQKRYRAMALCDAVPVLTALSNDYDYAVAYEEMLKNYASKGDVLVAISGSGNSPNILNAVRYARELGMTVIGLTGRDGGKLAPMCDPCLIAPTHSMEEIEDIHSCWSHALISALRGGSC